MKTISKEDYYKLLGLRHLATMKENELKNLVLAVAEITGEKLDEFYFGHSADFVYSGDMEVEKLLTNLKIEVLNGPKK